MRPRKGAIFCCLAKKMAIKPARTVAVAHGRYGVQGICRFGAGGSIAVEVIISVVLPPLGLPAVSLGGLRAHVTPESDAGTAHVKLTE